MRTTTKFVLVFLIAFGASAGCGSSDDAPSSSSAGGSGADAGTLNGGDTGSDAQGEPIPRELGAACETDADCRQGLKCFTAASKEWTGMGPAKGYCSADCTGNADICKTFDPSALCFDRFPESISVCVAGCAFGPDKYTTFDPAKCHGRSEVACVPAVTFDGNTEVITPACMPTCNSDADCGDGLWCNPLWGLCSATPPQGLDDGAECHFNEGECKGACKPMLDDAGQLVAGYCAGHCTTGAVPNCGWGGPGTGPAKSFCLWTLSPVRKAGGPSAGDVGLCVQLCDCNADCAHPNFVCVPWSSTETEMEPLVGRKGSCGPPPELPDGTKSLGITCG